MNFKIEALPEFIRELKRLAKKYSSLKVEIQSLVESLSKDPFQGTSLGGGTYKIRLSINSKGKGKSGGARIITNVVVVNEIAYLLSIYDKSEKENLTDKELKFLLKQIKK